jgi:hypothetical protein
VAWAQQDTINVVFLTLQSQTDWRLLADLRQMRWIHHCGSRRHERVHPSGIRVGCASWPGRHRGAPGGAVGLLGARAMFRLLKDLYRRLGWGKRTEALVRAQERGWL